MTTDADRNVAAGSSCSVNVPVCRSNTATPAVTPAGTRGLAGVTDAGSPVGSVAAATECGSAAPVKERERKAAAAASRRRGVRRAVVGECLVMRNMV
ncbi:hypothetical protein [Streptomyces cinereoruber]|uniref:hypothetical protein n=1 Tax=Streptomyces cinereoruber TaxID=67260 RepID=UPI00363768B6